MEKLFELSDAQLGQYTCLNALVLTLLDQGVLDGAKYYQHLCLAANRLEELDLVEAAGLVDEQRAWLSDVLHAPSKAQADN